MLKTCWPPPWRPKTSRYCVGGLLFVLILASTCTSSSGVGTPIPTAVLIPSTATFTPPPSPTATSTREPALRPDALRTSVPPYLNTIPVEARNIVQAAAEEVLSGEDVSQDQLSISYFSPITWREDELQCIAESASLRRIEGYHVVFLSGDQIFEYRTNETNLIKQCTRAPLDETPPELLILFDVVAGEMALAAQERVSSVQDVPISRIRLLSIKPIEWSDTSLGCPLQGQAYTPVQIGGYRIVVAYQDREVIFHTDFERIIECAQDDEVLPDPLLLEPTEAL